MKDGSARWRAPLFGKGGGRDLLQTLVETILRDRQLDERNAEGSLRGLGLRFVVLKVPEDQYLKVRTKAEGKGSSSESELERLLWETIGDADGSSP